MGFWISFASAFAKVCFVAFAIYSSLNPFLPRKRHVSTDWNFMSTATLGE